ncbi:TerC family protein [Paenibacillus sp. 481]|uniref:TerC family protein n=1 Tax=Paenibacillus sp. 481 TaxID=2835869 RepID=UPI001E412C6D|nr:TerC family protein [Paenibacillus sp. 481]UHA72815.1 TerC family protein [Paenibacillus sp. 481]
MELFSPEFWMALMSIILIDLVLAGDNAIVIGLAARNLPKEQQRKVILWGTFGAIAIRAVATLGVFYLLQIKGLLLIGGLLLIWIAIKLLADEKSHNLQAEYHFWAAVRTIVIADAVMGLDNVLAVAGAAHNSPLLVVLGLIISIPIVILGSTIILKFIDRFPIIITLGSAVLAWTAGKMIVGESFLKPYFANGFVKYGFELALVAVVLVTGWLIKRARERNKPTQLPDDDDLSLKPAQGE